MSEMKEILSVLAHAIELAQDELDEQETARQRVETEVESKATPNNSCLAEPERKFRTFQPTVKETDPDPAVQFHELRHVEYGKVQIAVVDGEVYYRMLDVGAMLGYANAKQCGKQMIHRIKLTAPNPIAPQQYARSTFIKMDDVRGMFIRRKLMAIPVCVKMYNWLERIGNDIVHNDENKKIS